MTKSFMAGAEVIGEILDQRVEPVELHHNGNGYHPNGVVELYPVDVVVPNQTRLIEHIHRFGPGPEDSVGYLPQLLGLNVEELHQALGGHGSKMAGYRQKRGELFRQLKKLDTDVLEDFRRKRY